MTRKRQSLLFFLCFVAALLVGGDPSGAQLPQQSQHAYHNSAPSEPPPPTLDPAEFRGNPKAFVAYTLAAQNKNTLYQVFCFCPCNKHEGHQSLLDCFTGRHGVTCHVCQKEAIFCFLETQKGKNPEEIRRDLTTNSFRKFDFEKYANRYVTKMAAAQK
jgi:hypothetical protein